MTETLRRPSRRERRWDGPRRAVDARWFVSTVGRVSISVGLLMFSFVAYQLWGTGIEYAQAQDRLDEEFADLLDRNGAAAVTTPATAPSVVTRASSATDPPTSAPPASPVPVTDPPPPPTTSLPQQAFPSIDEGDAIARIEVPAIGLDATVVAGVSTDDLKRGPGHYPGTPLPGQLGNSAIAGHRTTYGAPFIDVDRLVPGDEIVMTTVAGRFVYRVTDTQIVGPKDSHVIDTVDATVATLTLTSCHPKWTADQRIIISAALDRSESAPPGQPSLIYEQAGQVRAPDEPAGQDRPPGSATAASDPTVGGIEPTVPASTVAATPGIASPAQPGAVSEQAADAFGQGWFDDRAAIPHVALWGSALSAIAIGAYLASRVARTNWVGLLAGIAPFVVCLYFFFQNVNRLVPAAL